MNIKRTIRNFFTDIRVGGHFLGGGIKSRYASLGANMTSNSQYEMLDVVFDYMENNGGGIGPEDVLVDVGCGKGRVLNYWIMRYPDNKIYGLELDDEIAKSTSKRLRTYENCTIISGNALENIPKEGTILYLFNPFNLEVMKNFEKVVWDFNRNIRIIYLNCCHLNCFDNDHWDIDMVESDSGNLYDAALIKRKVTGR